MSASASARERFSALWVRTVRGKAHCFRSLLAFFSRHRVGCRLKDELRLYSNWERALIRNSRDERMFFLTGKSWVCLAKRQNEFSPRLKRSPRSAITSTDQ